MRKADTDTENVGKCGWAEGGVVYTQVPTDPWVCSFDLFCASSFLCRKTRTQTVWAHRKKHMWHIERPTYTWILCPFVPADSEPSVSFCHQEPASLATGFLPFPTRVFIRCLPLNNSCFTKSPDILASQPPLAPNTLCKSSICIFGSCRLLLWK